MLAELYILKGKDAGKFVKLGNEPFVFLGRSITNQIPLDDREVSRVHCRIEVRASTCVLKDLSSGNGTYINEERLEGERLLSDGDMVRIGKTVLTILLESEEEAEDWMSYAGDSGEVSAILGGSGDVDIEDDSSPAYTGVTPVPTDNHSATLIMRAIQLENPSPTMSSDSESEDMPAPFSSEEEQALEVSEMRGNKKSRVSLRDLVPGLTIERKLSAERGAADTVVYKAFQKSLERAVAVKTLLARGEQRDKLARRFLREVARVARLPHRNIVTIHDAGRVKNFFFFVMEYLAGGSVSDLIAEGSPMPLAHALRLAHEISEAIDYIHTHGVVHRGINPGSILIDTSTNTGKLCGFGFSKEVEMSAGDTTFLSAPLDGFAYLSPEQVLGKRTSPKVDIYSLGATLYTMLAGRPPYKGKSHVALAQAIIDGSAPAVESLAPELPVGVAEIVRRAMMTEESDRFESAAEMTDALHRARVEAEGQVLRSGKSH